MRSGEIQTETPLWREASRVKCLAQGHLEAVWVLMRFKLLGGEKQVGLSVLLGDTCKKYSVLGSFKPPTFWLGDRHSTHYSTDLPHEYLYLFQENVFPGLVPVIKEYLSNMEVDIDTQCTIQQYLSLIQKRASGR
jgi:hypothetical protein